VNYVEAVQDLDARQPEHMPEPSLDRIQRLAELLDHPERTYPTIHVTGTNGKGTTARLVTDLACEHGLTTGTFVSPHLVSVTERLSVCGEPISEEDFAEEYARLLPYVDSVNGFGPDVTYFEILTAMAYLWFADKPVRLGVFEVGLGGTWDATNLIEGDEAVITPIGLDHVGILGETVEEIATEKAGIIKPGKVAVVREQRPEALTVIERRAGQIGATVLLEDRDWALEARTRGVGGQAITVQGTFAGYEEFFFSLFGEPAARNAAAAVVATEALLGRALDDGAVRRALGSATSPGRVEVVQRHPTVVLDGAHNPDATAALAETLRESFRWERLHLVVAMFEDKAVEEALANLVGLADLGYAASNSSARSAPAERVAAAVRAAGLTNVATFDSVGEAVESSRTAAGEDDLILVTGSFYTVGDARPLFVRA
jgi:dihydrofolate synthase/folylpolyglutamate synthase